MKVNSIEYIEEDYGTNPCSEIILRSGQFCNLTEVVARPEDSFDRLKEKVKLATILGTLQATLTDFRYLRSHWKKNTEEEALLGVSITGIMDHPILAGGDCTDDDALARDFARNPEAKSMEEHLAYVLKELKEVAIETNREWSSRLGINPSAAITCVKPSGTVSQLVDSASGIHARHSKHYIRTVRTDKKDPMYQFLKDQGVPVEDAFGKEDSTAVFSFPVKAPEGAITRNEMSALEQLEIWKVYALNWCEHKPSVTVTVREHEWMEVGAWVYENFDICSGVSFLPHSDHVYRQAPYQECTKEEYEEALAKMPEKVQWERLSEYEFEDTTTGTQELACTGGACEIV